MENLRHRKKFNPNDYHLGNICKRNHSWEDSGKSLRHNKWYYCLQCHRHDSAIQNKKPSAKARQRRYNDKRGKRKLTDAQKQRKVERQRWRVQTKGFTPIQRKNKSRLQYKFKKKKLNQDSYFALVERLRSRIYQAFKVHTRTGKFRTSKAMGIDYKAIILHVGPCPGNPKEYEIDHIRAIAKFDLTDPSQIIECFAPSNHQWLLKAINRAKGAK